MNGFVRSNKVTGIYWLQKPIKKINIKVKLKAQGGILSLPKFEDYAKEPNHSNLKLEHLIEEHVFEWQEKKFSHQELELYKDSRYCKVDKDLAYHDMIQKNLECTSSKVFSYIHEDNYVPLPFDNKRKNQLNSKHINTFFKRVLIDNNLYKFCVPPSNSDSSCHIFESEESIRRDDEWTAMHIVYDNSEYDEFSQLISKQEVILISLYHNKARNYLIVTPDNNNIEFNPYVLVSDSGTHSQYHYSVDISFEDCNNGEDIMILLKRLYKKWRKKQRSLINFVMPSPSLKKYYLIFEIITATGFEMDNLYIEYNFKVPDEVVCNDTLHGKTHVSKSIRVNKLDQCNFGHTLELELEINTNLDHPKIKLFFEVISVDWWCCHRTEGYSYYPLSLTPGSYTKQLSCSRPEELNKIEAESRRFFVGGCHLIKDLDVLAEPELLDANFTYTASGTMELRWNVIAQHTTLGASAVPPSRSSVTGTSSAVLDGAETALRKYSKARAKMAAATKDLDITYALDNQL